ncbi:MAG: hypothetical protein ABWZ53_02375 [Actinomycetota bacterium]
MTTFRGLTSHDWCVAVEPFHLTTDDGPTSTARGLGLLGLARRDGGDVTVSL